MSVEFTEEENFNKSYRSIQPEASGINNFFIKIGLAKSESGARVVMILISIVCFALAIYFAKK